MYNTSRTIRACTSIEYIYKIAYSVQKMKVPTTRMHLRLIIENNIELKPWINFKLQG